MISISSFNEPWLSFILALLTVFTARLAPVARIHAKWTVPKAPFPSSSASTSTFLMEFPLENDVFKSYSKDVVLFGWWLISSLAQPKKKHHGNSRYVEPASKSSPHSNSLELFTPNKNTSQPKTTIENPRKSNDTHRCDKKTPSFSIQLINCL